MKTFGTTISCSCGNHFVEMTTVKPDDNKRRWVIGLYCLECKRTAIIELLINVLDVREPFSEVEYAD